MDPIRLHFQYQPDEIKESLEAASRRFRTAAAGSASPELAKRNKPTWRIWSAIALIAVILGVILAQNHSAPAGPMAQPAHRGYPIWVWAIVIGIVVFLTLLRPLVWYLNRRYARSAFAAASGLTFNVTADNSGLIWDDSRTISTHHWKALSAYTESAALFTLFQDDPAGERPMRVFAIPKRAIGSPSDVGSLRELLRKKVGENGVG